MNVSSLQTGIQGPDTPRVTIVTPIYNAAEFLAGAVKSVLAQTYPSWELLLVDDGSTDGSDDLAERYAAQHLERVRFLHHQDRANRGASASRNLGIEHARGEFVALLDADDRWEPRKLEKQIAFLDRHPNVAAVGSWYREMDRSGKSLSMIRLPCTHLDITWGMLFYCPLLHSSVVMRRVTIGEHIGWYDEALATAEDYDLWTRIARRFELANVPEVLVTYRVHGASLSATRGRSEAHGWRLRRDAIARLLEWQSDSADVRLRCRAMAFLVLGWADEPDPVALRRGVADLHRLHDVFCRQAAVPERVRRRRRRALDRQTASSLLNFSSHFRRDRPADAQALLVSALRLHPAAALRVRTWTRTARLLARRLQPFRALD